MMDLPFYMDMAWEDDDDLESSRPNLMYNVKFVTYLENFAFRPPYLSYYLTMKGCLKKGASSDS